jgi:hypothetical protein
MNNQNLLRGLFLMAIALAFGLVSMNYPMGDLGRAGPGMFPALVSSLLFIVGLSMVIHSRFVPRKPMGAQYKNIAVIIGSLCAFALVSTFVNMIAAIVAMVFLSTIAGSNYSWFRNVKISIGLVLMAFVFARLLGMNLPLY